MPTGPSLPKGLPFTFAGCGDDLHSSRDIHHIDESCSVYCEDCAPTVRLQADPTAE